MAAVASMRALRAGPENMKGLLKWVKRCNSATSEGKIAFEVDKKRIGYVSTSFGELLLSFQHFQESRDPEGATTLTMSPTLDTTEKRTEAMAAALKQLRERGAITGWRNELYPAATGFGKPPVLLLERAAAPLFGILAYGVHVNGYVVRHDGLYLWVARRSQHKPTWPGRLDHIAAGGQPHGIDLATNVAKECKEEAGIPEALARQAVPTGVVSYVADAPQDGHAGMKRDVLFCYDLLLPSDFVPQPVDAEVESFVLWPAQKVLDAVAESELYKDNCNLVLIDFFVRHGLIGPDCAGYVELVYGLRNAGCT